MTASNKIFFFLLYSSCIVAQQRNSLAGQFVDETGKPIVYLEVVVMQNDMLKTAEITDEKGMFRFQLAAGTYTLLANHFGTNVYKQEIQLSTPLDLGQLPIDKSIQLGEVVIQAEKNIIEKVGDKIIYNVENTDFNAGNNGIEVLRNTPIVWIDNNDQILVRQEPATVLINGRKINLKGENLSEYIKSFDAEHIKRIEIQTNASADVDGENNGVFINVITNKRLDGFKMMTKSFYSQKQGGYFAAKPEVSFRYGIDSLSFYGNYSYLKESDNPIYNSENINLVNDISIKSNGSSSENIDKHNYRLGFVYDITKNQAIGMETYSSEVYNSSKAKSNIHVVQIPNSLDKGNIITNLMKKNNHKNGTLNYSIRFKPNESILKFFIDYTKQNLINSGSIVSNYHMNLYDNSAEQNISKVRSDIFSTQIDFQKKSDLFDFETGLKYANTNKYDSLLSQDLKNGIYVENDRTSYFNYKESIVAGYFSVSKEIKKLYIKTGLRYENTSFEGLDLLKKNHDTNQNYDDFFPFIYISKNLSNKKELSLSYSKRITRPSFTFLNNVLRKLNDFTFSIGNPSLKPEYTNAYNANLSFKNQVLDLHYYVTIEKINTRWFTEEGINYHQTKNFGTSKQFGISYNINHMLKKWWQLNIQTAVLYREFEANNKIAEKPSSMFSLTNVFKFDGTSSLDLLVQYTSPFIDGSFSSGESLNSNLIFKKAILKDRFFLRLYIQDVFNTLEDKNNGSFDQLRTSFFQKRKTRRFTIWLSYNLSLKNKILNNKVNESKNDTRKRL